MNFCKSFISKLFFCCLLGWALLSCSNEEDTMVLLQDHEYLPLQVGAYQVYDVTETTYTGGPSGVTQTYELRTEVVDSFPNTDGFYSYQIFRYKRPSATDEWTYSETWTATFTNREAIMQEGNVSFVKLDLPIVRNAKWNGNLYNTLGEDEYMFASMPSSFVAGVLPFDDVLEVVQNDDVDNIVGNDIRKEFYARGVGLIQKNYEVITYCTVGDCLGQQQIESGVIRTQIIKEYGKL
jgi:hypothetical protein